MGGCTASAAGSKVLQTAAQQAQAPEQAAHLLLNVLPTLMPLDMMWMSFASEGRPAACRSFTRRIAWGAGGGGAGAGVSGNLNAASCCKHCGKHAAQTYGSGRDQGRGGHYQGASPLAKQTLLDAGDSSTGAGAKTTNEARDLEAAGAPGGARARAGRSSPGGRRRSRRGRAAGGAAA